MKASESQTPVSNRFSTTWNPVCQKNWY